MNRLITKPYTCWNCGRVYSYESRSCPSCGKWNLQLRADIDKMKKRKLIIAVLCCGICITSFMAYTVYKDTEISHKEKIIKQAKAAEYLESAKILIKDGASTGNEAKVIVDNMLLIQSDSPVYQEAQRLYPKAMSKANEIEKNEENLQQLKYDKLVNNGKRIHKQIISKHKNLDANYLDPFITGSLTHNPLCAICVPISDWNELTEDQKKSLSIYAQSLIGTVIKSPFKYSGVASSAPAAPYILQNIRRMTPSSWCIYGGELFKNGREISTDIKVVSGN